MQGTASYDAWLVVAVVLAASLCMVPVFLLMRMTRNRKKEPIVVVSPDSAQKHIAIIWLIRAGEALIIGPLTLLALAIGVGFVISINPFKPQALPLEIPDQPVASEIYSVIMCIIVLGVGFFIGRKLIGRLAKFDRHSFYEKHLRVNSNSVSMFSLVFAAVSAHDLYQLMPAKPPEPGPGVSAFRVFILDRNIMWILVFWGLWRLVYVIVCRVLDLKPPAPPASSKEPPIDPETPEFPRKSPLVQM